MRTAPLVALMAAALAGCGSSSPRDAAPGPTIRNAAPWTEAQIIEAAGLTTNDGGDSYSSASCSQVAVILTSRAAVDTYASAGDTVVTNPGGTAGVKVIDDEAACLADLERGLAALE